jgi:chaperonin GroES
MMNIRPLDDRVVVEAMEAEEKSPGGIVIPDTAKEKPRQGKVVAVGPGKLLDSGKRSGMLVSKGDMVLFGKYAGSDVRVGEIEYKIMRETDILGLVEGAVATKTKGKK